jgi:O-antigen/teichoic acid export membrane protein
MVSWVKWLIHRWLVKSHLVSIGATDTALVGLMTISGILVARLLGPQGRGQYAIAILWPSVILAVGNLGLREAFTYEQARAPELRSILTAHALILGLGQSVLLMALGAVLVPLLTRTQAPEVTQAGLLFLLVIPAILQAQYALGLLQGNLDIPVFNVVRLSVSVVYLLGTLLLWAMSAMSVWNATLALVVANFVTGFMALVTVLTKFGASWRLDRGLTRGLLSYGIRNHAGSLSFMLNQRADQMLMAVLITPVQLGWYTAAVSISAMARLASGAFGTLAFPKVTNKPVEEQRRVTGMYSRLNVTITVVLGVGLMLSIPLLIPLLYGRAYLPSILPAEILTIGAICVGIGQAWASSLRGLGYPLVPAKAEAISLVATVIGLALTLRTLGIVGASLTSLGAYFIASLYMYGELRRVLAVNLRDLLSPVSLAVVRSRHIRSNTGREL